MMENRQIDSSRSTWDDYEGELKEAMRGKHFSTRKEAQAFLDGFIAKRSSSPVECFNGLSPNQIFALLYSPFDAPELVDFPAVLDTEPSASIVSLFRLLADGIDSDGLKPTATGNLPRKFLQAAFETYAEEDETRREFVFGKILMETDFPDIHITRVVAELGGLVRKYKGKFILSRECRKLLSGTGIRAIYPKLLKAHADKFNWGYNDYYPEIPFLQQSFAYNLLLLQRYGDEWCSSTFYEDAFLKAFPRLVRQVEPQSYSPPEGTIRECYSHRFLREFAEFLGLAEIKSVSYQDGVTSFQVRKKPLLDQAVRFKV